MPRKRYQVDQIIPMLRRADVELGKGNKVPEICKMLGISQQTYYRWRQKYGGMAPEMARELKALQDDVIGMARSREDLQQRLVFLQDQKKGQCPDTGASLSSCCEVYIPCMSPRNHAACNAILSGHFRSLLAQFGLTPKSRRGLAASEVVEAL